MANRSLDDRIINLVDTHEQPWRVTLTDLHERVGAPRSTVAYHVRKLVREGQLERLPDESLKIATPVRQLAFALEVEHPAVIDITERIRERGILRHSAHLRGFFNLLMTVQLPRDYDPSQLEELLRSLGAREVRALGELVPPMDMEKTTSSKAPMAVGSEPSGRPG